MAIPVFCKAVEFIAVNVRGLFTTFKEGGGNGFL